MSIVFSRVDGRMIHGQVAIAWTRLLQIDEILVINDEVAKDDTQNMLLELAVPSGIDLTVCSVDDAADMILNDELSGSRTMIVYKTLSDAIRIMEKGINAGPINIGGMYHEEGKTQYAKALCLDDNDINGLRKLRDNNVELFYQIAPMNDKEDLKKHINNF
jgi:mannose/fructose/N-acetylgalactosamine-specific phosphotransferase system component IIB